MLTNVSKWGNSLGIRIPNTLAKQLDITDGEQVELTIEDNHLLIHKVCHLDSLLAKVTPDNIHSEIDTGNTTGNETW